jgi:BlaI family penicillinase repressor
MPAHNPLHHTDADTLSMLLPTAEVEILRIVWARGPSTVKGVHAQITAQRDLAYTAVLTTMYRLFEKGVFTRHRDGLGYVYTPTISERELITRTLHQILDCVVRDYPSAIAHYLDTQHETATF